MSGRRSLRVASMIRGELARLLLEEISDPGLNQLVVTEVSVSDDLKKAKVYYTCSSVEGALNVSAGISRAVPFLRKRLGTNLALRAVPALEFRKDDHVDRVNRVMGLLDEVAVES